MMNFPNSPVLNQQYNNGSTTYAWDGTAWNIVPQMGPIYISDTPPANPAVGQEWWRSSTGQKFIWYQDQNSSQWVEEAGVAAAPGLWEPIQGGLIKGNAANAIILQNLSAYYDIRMKLKTLVNGSDVGIYMALSSDNGATFPGATNQYAEQLSENAGTSYGGLATQSGIIAISGTVACAHSMHNIWLTDFNKASQPTFFDINGNVFRASGGLLKNSVVGYEGTAMACNALKIYPGAATFNYHLIIEGVRG